MYFYLPGPGPVVRRSISSIRGKVNFSCNFSSGNGSIFISWWPRCRAWSSTKVSAFFSIELAAGRTRMEQFEHYNAHSPSLLSSKQNFRPHLNISAFPTQRSQARRVPFHEPWPWCIFKWFNGRFKMPRNVQISASTKTDRSTFILRISKTCYSIPHLPLFPSLMQNCCWTFERTAHRIK